MPLEIVLARHGETEWSRDGRHPGRTDVPLTEEGHRQALLLRDALAEWTFVKVLSSPMGRALGLFTALVGVGFSAWLTYAEIVLIEAICAWCVTSAVLITLALILTAVRAARAGSGPEAEGTARRSGPDPSPQGPSPPATPG